MMMIDDDDDLTFSAEGLPDSAIFS